MTTNNTNAISIPSNDSLVVVKTLLFRMGCNLPRNSSPLLEVEVCVPKEELGKVVLYCGSNGVRVPNSSGIYVRTKFWNKQTSLLPIYTRISLTKYIEMLSVFNYIFVESIKGTYGKTLKEAHLFMKGYMAHFRRI